MPAPDGNERFLDPDNDPFKPPALNTEVGCLHCQETYDSYLIEWRVFTKADGSKYGFWCCPTPGCDGKGFGFDILPTDPNYQDEHGGWVFDDDDDDDDDMDDEDDGYFEPDVGELDLETDDETKTSHEGNGSHKDDEDLEPPSKNGHDVPW